MGSAAAAPLKPFWGRPFFLISASLILSGAMAFYVNRILIPYQKAYAVAHDLPRGTLSDLYPRWLGARELWLHGRNPYAPDVTREIQTGYYGRPLDPRRPNDPGDQQGFAYPVYVTFLLAPTVSYPFNRVRPFFTCLLAALTCASICWWLRVLRWRPGWAVALAAVLLTLGSFPGLQGVKLQQLSLLVAALIAASAALLVSGYLFLAGVVLAIATIKPQLVALLSVFLLLWTLTEWRTRQRFFWGFAITLLTLVLGAEYLLHGWISYFWQALHEYQRYTGGQSRLDVLLGPILGKIVALAILIGLAVVAFRFRRLPSDQPVFPLVLAIVLTATLLVIPNFAPYNQLLLLPAIFVVIREMSGARRTPGLRVGVAAAAAFLSWGWLAAVALSVASAFLPAATVQQAWFAPLWSEFAIAPAFLLVLAILLRQADQRDTCIG